jgi:chemotaxis response regulator CheB
MNVDEYEVIRSEPAQFAVIAGHQIPDAEDVVVTHDHYLIVRKHGDAGIVANQSDPRHHLTHCRVVVVDDIAEIRYLLKMLLAIEPSCEVVGEAVNGAEAIEVVDATRPEVIVLDLEMPVLDGWHALPHLRRISPTSHVIVFSSTEVDARLEKRLRNLGADRFIRKGGNPMVLIEAVRDVATSGRDRVFDDQEQPDARVNGNGDALVERRSTSRNE